jgi:hypothetical protein
MITMTSRADTITALTADLNMAAIPFPDFAFRMPQVHPE